MKISYGHSNIYPTRYNVTQFILSGNCVRLHFVGYILEYSYDALTHEGLGYKRYAFGGSTNFLNLIDIKSLTTKLRRHDATGL